MTKRTVPIVILKRDGEVLGCIALEDGDARALYNLVPVGTEIEIRA